MKLFNLFNINKRQKQYDNNIITKNAESFLNSYDDFSKFYNGSYNTDSYLLNAWVNIAIDILIRNFARADFIIRLV